MDIDDNDLDADLNKVKTAVELLRKRVTHSTGVFASYNELKAKYEIANNIKNELANELENLKDDEEKRKLEYTTEASSYESIIKDLKLSISEKNSIIEPLENNIFIKDTELIKLRRDLDDLIILKHELAINKDAIAEKDWKIQVIESELLEAVQLNDTKDKQIMEFQDKINIAEDLLSMNSDALSSTSDELEYHKTQMINLQATHESKMKSLSQLIYKLNGEISRLPVLESRISDLSNHIRGKDKKIFSLKEKNQESKDQISTLDFKLNKTQSEAVFLRNLVEEVNEKLDVSDSDLDQTREALLCTVSTVKTLETEVKKSKSRIHTMSHTITSNQSKIGSLERMHIESKIKIQRLEDTNRELSQQILQFEKLHDSLTESYTVIQELKSQLVCNDAALLRKVERENELLSEIQENEAKLTYMTALLCNEMNDTKNLQEDVSSAEPQIEIVKDVAYESKISTIVYSSVLRNLIQEEKMYVSLKEGEKLKNHNAEITDKLTMFENVNHSLIEHLEIQYSFLAALGNDYFESLAIIESDQTVAEHLKTHLKNIHLVTDEARSFNDMLKFPSQDEPSLNNLNLFLRELNVGIERESVFHLEMDEKIEYFISLRNKVTHFHEELNNSKEELKQRENENELLVATVSDLNEKLSSSEKYLLSLERIQPSLNRLYDNLKDLNAPEDQISIMREELRSLDTLIDDFTISFTDHSPPIFFNTLNNFTECSIKTLKAFIINNEDQGHQLNKFKETIKDLENLLTESYMGVHEHSEKILELENNLGLKEEELSSFNLKLNQSHTQVNELLLIVNQLSEELESNYVDHEKI